MCHYMELETKGRIAMKKVIIVVLVLLLGASFVSVASAATTYDIMPTSGLSTQSILVSVRGDPFQGDYKQYMSVFFEGIMVKDRVLCVDLKNGNYRYMWDQSFIPPKGANGYGQHRITIWLETEFGVRKTLYYTYTIIDGMPGTVDAWELYVAAHPEILVQLHGPVGPKGDTGAEGGAGARGVKGEVGAVGPTAQVDYNQIWLSVPPVILDQLKGEPGDQGESASNILLAAVFVINLLASFLFAWYFSKPKEAKM